MNKPANDPASRNPHQRVVITGMGAITPVGHTVAETWESLKAGCSGVGRITSFDATPWACQIAGELKGFDPLQFIPRKKARYMALASQLAVIATGQALEDAGLDLGQEDRDRIGVLIGTAGGSTIEETERMTVQLMEKGSGRLSPFQVVRLWPNMASYFVAETYQVRGYNGTVCTACASATQAIGDAAEVIRRGGAEVMITGGAESVMSQTMLAGFTAMRALATSYNDEPERAMRPFEANREGFVGAQGSAMLILESLAHAQARGARVTAEVLGSGVSNDAFHMIAPDPEGNGAALAICVMTLNEGIIHPTINYETPDPECDLDYVPNEARRAEVKVAVSDSFGLGGQNAVLVLGTNFALS